MLVGPRNGVAALGICILFRGIVGQGGESCEQILQSDLAQWLTLSGGPSRLCPSDWDGIEWRNNLDFAEVRIHSNEVALACSINGGRTWEVLLEHNGITSNFTVCAPAVCTAEEASHVVARAFVATVVESKGHSRYREVPLLPQDLPHINITTRDELFTWASLPVDLLIPGVNGCGTHSLFGNLKKHPQIAFAEPHEDPFWDRLVLPSATHVKWLEQRKQSTKSGRPKLLGMYNPAGFMFPWVMAITELIPHLKVLMLVGDPVRLFEKFWWHDSREAQADPPLPETAWWTVARRFRNAEGGVHARQISRLLQRKADATIVVHQSHFRNNPRDAYRRLTADLGLEDFAPEFQVRRYNLWFGCSVTKFCKNQSMVRRLSRLFEEDYETAVIAVRKSGWPITQEMVRRLSHCETTQWGCGSEYTRQSSVWNRISGGRITVLDGLPRSVVPNRSVYECFRRYDETPKLRSTCTAMEALLAECESLHGIFWHVKVTNYSGVEQGDISVCAPAICSEAEVSEGVTYHVLKSTEDPHLLDKPFTNMTTGDLLHLTMEVKSRIVGSPGTL